ncbi:MAG TPA: TonB-dependent receptor plug domain-containing protein, partial [Steroidobacteraceae bacterium]|nr:TonB-dependent receptor plug domain-containing protein [Steroidobacteraceae bacterium]
MLSYKLSRSIKHALWMGTAATLSTAYCSTAIAANAASDSDSMDEVVVTGSRIAGSLLGSSTPVQVLTETDLVSGSVNASDFLRNLPGVGISGFSSANSNFATSSAGVNTINLRNLGDSRTLVLVNGRRFVPGVAGDSAVDFNMIPTDFIDHIEVITGGASAVYGSEAISGVVNVIYKKDFEGISVRGQVGSATEGGSGRVMGALTAGAKVADGRGNIL